MNRPGKETASKIVVGSVIALTVLTVFIGMSKMPRSEVQPDEQPTEIGAVAWDDHDIVGGLPSHRREIDDYIGRVSKEDLSTLVANLNLHENILIRISWPNDPFVEPSFQKCLANRRLAKIYELLAGRPIGEARVKAREIWKQKFATYQSGIERCLDEWETIGAVKAPIPLSDNFTALCSASFLCVAFCAPNEWLRLLDDWNVFAAASMKRISSNPQLAPLQSEMTSYGPPEDMFLVNVFLWFIGDQFGVESVDEALENITPRTLHYRAVQYVAWNGHTNAFDFTHEYSGVPIDQSRVLRKFLLCESWVSGGAITREHRKTAVMKLREKLNAYLAP